MNYSNDNQFKKIKINKLLCSMTLIIIIIVILFACLSFLVGIGFSTWTGIECATVNQYSKVNVTIVNINKISSRNQFDFNFLIFDKNYYNITLTCYTLQCINKYDKLKINDIITLYKYNNKYITTKDNVSCNIFIFCIFYTILSPIIIIIIFCVCPGFYIYIEILVRMLNKKSSIEIN
jgi:hypothetical protein